MGAGINLFRQLFPEDYYAYQTATLISSKPVSKVIKDSNDQTIATYPLGGDELRGILKVENGQLVAYGDVKGSDGNGTEVFDIVDLGTLNWQATSYDHIFYCDLADKQLGYDSPLLCAEYEQYHDFVSGLGNMQISGHPTYSLIYIRNDSCTTTSDITTALNGVYLIYEKATPTAKSYTPFTNPMLCGATEEFTDSRSLKMPTGYQALYYTSPFKNW